MRRVLAGIVFFLFASVAIAQSTFRGSLSGMVVDPQGAIIPAATIQATNSATGLVYKAVSSSAGDYSIPGTLNFQRCNDSMCEPPQSVHFELPIKID